MVRIEDKQLEIDIAEELEPYLHLFDKHSMKGEKLVSCSPFRSDGTPSFFINMEGEFAGTWRDSGALEGSDMEKGNLVKILAHFRSESYDETKEYLLDKYDHTRRYVEKLELKPNLTLPTRESSKAISMNDYYDMYGQEYNNYLEKRGISKEIQEEAGIVYFEEKESMLLPWRSHIDRVECVKLRNVIEKKFRVTTFGKTTTDVVYGLELYDKYAKSRDVIAICEGEVDALSWRQFGILGLGLGTAHLHDAQKEAILKRMPKNLIICGDTDKPGRALNKQLVKVFAKYCNIFELILPEDCKDINDFVLKYPGKFPKLVEHSRLSI